MSETPPYQHFRPLSPEEREGLKEDIRQKGVLQPIVVDEEGRDIDGHQRLEICEELGIECPRDTRAGLTEQEKHAIAISLNAHRRQLTPAEKEAVLREQLKAQPELSNRQHAAASGLGRTKVGEIRKEMETSGELAVADSLRGADQKVRRRPSVSERKQREQKLPSPAPTDTSAPRSEQEPPAPPLAPADDGTGTVPPAPESPGLGGAKPPETQRPEQDREKLPTPDRPEAYQIPLNPSAAGPIINSQLAGEGEVENLVLAAVAEWKAQRLAGLVAKLGALVADPVPDRVPSDPEADWEAFRRARYRVPVPLRQPALADLLFDNDGDSMADEIRVAGRGWVGPCYRAELANGLLRTLPYDELSDDMMPVLAANLAKVIARLPDQQQREIGKTIAHRLEIQIDGRRKRKQTAVPQEVDEATQAEPSPGRDRGSGK